jgi:hypothetical protein
MINNEEVEVSLMAVVDYCCNRFLPLILVPALLIISLGATNWVTWAVIALAIFIDRNCFKVGYAVGFCDSKEGREYGSCQSQDE